MRWLLPALALVVIHQQQGAAYAMGSWVPPQLATVFIFGSFLRLRPEVPLMMGIGCAVSFGLVHIPVALYPATRSDDLDFPR